jgi:hypothetical protein
LAAELPDARVLPYIASGDIVYPFRFSLIRTAFLALIVCAVGLADTFPYKQGFETGTSGWTPETGGTNAATITRVPSGTGGINAADGGYYAQVTNSEDAYLPGYGDAGFSFFGGNGTYPGGGFYQSIDVYIDTTLSQPGQAYWIDMSPSSSDPNDVANNNGLGYGDEQNFRLSYTGTGVDVTASGAASPFADITSSGWYQFEITYQPGANPTDLVNTDMLVYNLGSNSLAGSMNVIADQDGETLQNQYLAGPGYVWLTVWQNGFSNDQLNIDDIQTSALPAVPEPGSSVLLTTIVAAAGFRLRRRRN